MFVPPKQVIRTACSIHSSIISDATIYVGGLDEKVDEGLMWELFVQAGPVVNVHMPKVPWLSPFSQPLFFSPSFLSTHFPPARPFFLPLISAPTGFID